MENGVENFETKTADGAVVSEVQLGDNVVQVFHDVNDDKKEEEAVSSSLEEDLKLKLVDDVGKVFHEKKDSEVDEVFEEASDEVSNIGNGEVSGEEVEKFEEAVETDLEDQNLPVEGVVDVKEEVVVPEELPDEVVVSNGEEEEQDDGNEVFVMTVDGETKSVTDDEIVSSGIGDVHGESGNGMEVGLVDNDDRNEVQLDEEESPDGVVCNLEGEENEASVLIVDGETFPLVSAEIESNGRCDAVVHEKSDNGGLKKLELVEKVAVIAKSSNFSKTLSGEVASPEEDESGGQILSEDALSRNGIESREKISESDQSCELRQTAAHVDTFVKEEIQTPETENVTNAISFSADEETEREIKNGQPDTSDVAESEEKDSRNLHVPDASVNIDEGSSSQDVVKEPEVLEIQDKQKKEESPSIGELRDSGLNRDPEILPVVEPVQAPLSRRPAGLGGAAPLFEPATRAPQQPRVNGAAPERQAQLVEDPINGEPEETDETREKLQMIRVKFLRLAHRLGQTPHNVVVAQVLYRLGLAEQLRGRNASRVGAFSFDRASAMAEQLESAGQEPLDFSCTIMVLGKSGVGKSATINSIFDENKFSTDAFQMGTKKVQDVVGTVQGIKVRVIDTPGLLPCWSDQRQNEKILHSVKRFIKKTPPDIVLYLDRLDMQSRDLGDLPLLRTITEIFGPSIWFNAIVVLTHAASAPPEGPNGTATSYEMFVTQRSHVVQQAIRQAAGDMRLMNPVSLVENHSACRTNRAGQRVLPNGQVWKPHLLLLSFASKILAEANTLLKLQDNPPGKPFAARPRVPPLPFLLSSLLQSRPQLKLPEEQFGDEDEMDEDLDESSDSDEESEYDELPPFKRLTKAQLAKLSKAQKKAYFDELEYREKLFMKKQLREEKQRRRLLKKMASSAKELPNEYTESAEEESGGAASVPTAMPDFALPASFDSDNPSHRYRFLDNSNQWLVRPVLEIHGWDHDVGYEGINAERLFVVKDKIPVSFSGQATKDKKESNLQMELASSIKHSEGKSTSVGFDMQTVGKDMSYTLRSETRFSNFRNNKTAAGLSVTLLGDALTAGVKLEDKLIVNKRLRVVLTGGAMTGRGDVAYGGSLEATLRDKDHPLGRTLSTLGLSIMDWHGDLAIGCNVQSQIPIGRSTNLIARANLNNRGAGQVSIRLNSSEQLQIALIGLLPLVRKILGLYQQKLYGE
ncbi:hypothetical protein IFM89_014494 [Coptis chinensis]|uniref:AIG1-type G domain-containing protein n=1 Tax=Coptis chinensis TaxID=261450 RepID=A0A835IMN4_9MAGN|nr:hypothetical protein IFM89_014494 [Coptis chinensis]